MITVSPALLPSQSITWAANSVPLALLGIYYGFITTLPFGFSQLVALRACLFEESDQRPAHWPKISLLGQNVPDGLIWSLGGLMVAQAVLLLSAYCPFLYQLWVRPHALSFLLLPYACFYLYRLLVFERLFRPDTRMWYTQCSKVFLDSFVFQIVNPVLLPSPVLARLMTLFLFRYSQIPLFLIGGFMGWLAGHATFALLCHFLLLRLQYDSPTVYRITQELNKPFTMIVTGLCLLLLVRNPRLLAIPTIHEPGYYKDRPRDLRNARPQTVGLLPLGAVQPSMQHRLASLKDWPNNTFAPYFWKRPALSLRSFFMAQKWRADAASSDLKVSEQTNTPDLVELLEDFPNDSYPWNQKRFSQHFFEAVVSDGKRRLSYSYPECLATFHKALRSVFASQELSQQAETTLYENWASTQIRHLDELNQSVSYRMESLDKGAKIEQVLEKRLSSLIDENPLAEKDSLVAKVGDPRLGQSLRALSLLLPSDWLLAELEQESAIQFTRSLEDGPLIDWIKKRVKEVELNIPSRTKEPYSTLLHKAQQAIALNEIPEDKEDPFERNSKEDFALVKRLPLQLPNWLAEADIMDQLGYIERRRFQPLVEQAKEARSMFVRDIFIGATRDRRRKAMLSNVMQRRPSAPFWARIGHIETNESLVNTANETITAITDGQRRRIRARYNHMWAHIFRGIVLWTQIFLRRFVKQPLFILLKTLVRFILFQPFELEQDLAEWRKEQIRSTEYLNENKYVALNWWNKLLQGFNVQINSPFCLEPWHGALSLSSQEPSYLDTKGRECERPFGTVTQFPSFWLPVMKELSLWAQQPSSSRWGLWCRKVYLFLQKVWKSQSNSNEQIATSRSKISVNPSGVITRGEDNSFSSMAQVPSSTEWKHSLTREQIRAEREKIESKLVEVKEKRIEFDSLMSRVNTTSSREPSSTLNTTSHVLIKESALLTDSLWKQRHRIQGYAKFSPSQMRVLSDESLRAIRHRRNQFKRGMLYLQRLRALVMRQRKRQTTKNWPHSDEWKTRITRSISRAWKWLYHWIKAQERRVFFYWEVIARVDLRLKYLWQLLVKQSIFGVVKPQKVTKSLSQAYVLHKIWETRTKRRAGISSLIKTWSYERTNRSSFERALTVQDVLKWPTPQSFGLSDWNKWLELMYHHAPPVQIWQKMAPQDWIAKPPLSLSHVLVTKLGLYPLEVSPVLNPLFVEAKRASTRFRFMTLAHGYTNLSPLGELTFKQEEPFWDDYITKQGNSFNGRTTLDIVTSEENNITAQLEENDIIDQLEENDLKNQMDRKRDNELVYVPSKTKKGSVSFYIKSFGPLRPNLLQDTNLLYNMTHMVLSLMQKAQDLNSPYKTLWRTAPMTPEETLLPKRLRTLRVLHNLQLTTNEPVHEINQLAYDNNTLRHVNNSIISMPKDEVTEEMRESRVIKRFLWPSHRLEDLACMNRFWFGTSNQSRLSSLRLRMYPSILQT